MAIMAESENRTLQDKFMLRLPDGMRERIRAAAEAHNRSMNSEIVATLEKEYPPPRTDREIYELVDLLLDYLPQDGSVPGFDEATTASLPELRRMLKNVLRSAEIPHRNAAPDPTGHD